jgi:transcriptional regulator with XRE-family HTH domain
MAKKAQQQNTGNRRVTGMDRVIGSRLRARRLEMKLSQEELGTKLGVSFQQVQKYEKGVNRIGSARLVEIASVLDVNVSYFLDNLTKANGKMLEPSKLTEFLGTLEGSAINEAMMKLNPAHRKSVVDLARSLARAYPNED